MAQYYNGKLWCEVCDQGFIRHVRINRLNQEAYICRECDAMWNDIASIGDSRIMDFGTFMEAHQLPWNWDELSFLDEELHAGNK